MMIDCVGFLSPPTSGGGGGAGSATKGGGGAFLVASSTAPAAIKARADYVCTGTNDQEVIQDAIEALGAGGGRVDLTGGVFNLSKNTRSPAYKIETNVELIKAADSAGLVTLVVADGGEYNQFDFLRIKGGTRKDFAADLLASLGAWSARTYSQNDVVTYDGKYWKSAINTNTQTPGTGTGWYILPMSMEENYQDTYAQVASIDGNTLTLLACITNDGYDDVTIERLQWAICLAKNNNARSPYLRGSGIYATQLRMAANADSIGIYTIQSDSAGESGTTSIDSGFGYLEFHGNFANQTAARVGLCPGVVMTNQDWHVQDVAVWYAAGPGLIATQGWGNHWVGGWIEYNWGPCVWQTTKCDDLLFHRVKTLALRPSDPAPVGGTPAVFATPPAILAEGSLLFDYGVLNADLSVTGTVELRGRASGSRVRNNRLRAKTDGTYVWVAPYTQVSISGCTVSDNRLDINSTKVFIKALKESPGNSDVLLGGWLVQNNQSTSAALTGFRPDFIQTVNNWNALTGVVSGNRFLMPHENKQTVWLYNNSGGQLSVGRLVRIVYGDNRTEALYVSNEDETRYPQYGLMAGTYATAGNARVMLYGKTMWGCNNGGGNIAVGDPLTVADTEGQGQKATEGDWVYAIAQQTRTSATFGLIRVVLLERPYQIPVSE